MIVKAFRIGSILYSETLSSQPLVFHGVLIVAILWERHLNGHHYQVRQAGLTRRLYTDNVFHTQYRPDRVLGGGYWDLLTLPALMLPEGPKIGRAHV